MTDFNEKASQGFERWRKKHPDAAAEEAFLAGHTLGSGQGTLDCVEIYWRLMSTEGEALTRLRLEVANLVKAGILGGVHFKARPVVEHFLKWLESNRDGLFDETDHA